MMKLAKTVLGLAVAASLIGASASEAASVVGTPLGLAEGSEDLNVTGLGNNLRITSSATPGLIDVLVNIPSAPEFIYTPSAGDPVAYRGVNSFTLNATLDSAGVLQSGSFTANLGGAGVPAAPSLVLQGTLTDFGFGVSGDTSSVSFELEFFADLSLDSWDLFDTAVVGINSNFVTNVTTLFDTATGGFDFAEAASGGFDLGGGTTDVFSVVVVPSPAAFGAGLILMPLVMLRRRRVV